MSNLLVACCVGPALWMLGLGLIWLGQIITIVEDTFEEIKTWQKRSR